MRHLLPVVLMLLLVGCRSNAEEKVKLESSADKVSYSIGLDIGRSFKQQGIEINAAALTKGIKDGLAGSEPMMTDAEIQSTMEVFQTEMMSRQDVKMKDSGGKNVMEGEAFLAENKGKEGIVTLPSGLQYKVLKPGSGRTPKATDTVVTHYRGRLINGKVFDSSYDRNEPATFPVNGVIAGWTEALQLMQEGAKWELYVPSDLAYGPRGAGADIGPNAVLIFEVELISVK